METNHYDAVICGPDLAGLLAANLLGRRGLRVLLVGHDEIPDGLAAGGHLLPRSPGLIPSLERETVYRVFAELNQIPILRRRAPRTRAALEAFVKERRLELADGDVGAALVRAFPEDAAQLATVMAHLQEIEAAVAPALGADINLPPEGFWERRELSRFEARLPGRDHDPLAPLPANHPARLLINAIASLSVRFAPADLGSVPRAHSLKLAGEGYHHLPGGLPALRELLLDKLQTVSGEVRERVTGFEVVMRRGRIRGLRLRPRDEVVGLEHMVWAGPLAQLSALLDERTGRRVREIAMAVRPACHRYCLTLLLRPEGVPAELGHRTISLLEPTRPPMEDNALALTIGSPLVRQPDLVPAWAECLVPAAVVGQDLSYLSVVRSRLRQHLSRLIPELDRILVAAASGHDGLPPELPGAVTLQPGPVPAHRMPALLSCDLPRTLDVGAVPHRTAIKNLHIASGETLPGLGAEGDFVAAWNVARQIAGRHRRRRLPTGRAALLNDA